jgi:hypothetical protein
LALDIAGRGDAEVRVVDGQYLEDRGGEPGPRESEKLGHRGLFKILPVQELFDQGIVNAAFDPGNTVRLFAHQGGEDSFSGCHGGSWQEEIKKFEGDERHPLLQFSKKSPGNRFLPEKK